MKVEEKVEMLGKGYNTSLACIEKILKDLDNKESQIQCILDMIKHMDESERLQDVRLNAIEDILRNMDKT